MSLTAGSRPDGTRPPAAVEEPTAAVTAAVVKARVPGKASRAGKVSFRRLLQGRAQAAGSGADAAAPLCRWRNAAQGGTGFVTGLLSHPSCRGLAYARTDIGGAYRWYDRSTRWIPQTDHLGWEDWNFLGVEATAVDPAHPNRLYLALGAYTQSWAGKGAELRFREPRCHLAAHRPHREAGRQRGDRLWLGTLHDGLLKSTDRGASWQAVRFPATPAATGQGVTLLVAAGRTVYAGWGDSDGTAGNPNLYRTSDGTIWEAVPGTTHRHRGQGADPLWSFGTANPGYRSADNGATWSEVASRRVPLRSRIPSTRPASPPSTPRPALCSPAPTAAGPSPRGPPA